MLYSNKTVWAKIFNSGSNIAGHESTESLTVFSFEDHHLHRLNKFSNVDLQQETKKPQIKSIFLFAHKCATL